KLEDCFYTGEVESAPNTSFVAVDTCSGLRGAIYYQNTTFVILPLPCPSCDPQTAPHIVLRWSSSAIAQNASMHTFWKPVDLMAMMQATVDQRLGDLSSVVHIIWLEFIVDEKLIRLATLYVERNRSTFEMYLQVVQTRQGSCEAFLKRFSYADLLSTTNKKATMDAPTSNYS
ncbi:unnamed protein product, partial [Hydatigera taeniaeformis]|uniref:Pep_M12B_propep domain-containing protein n=1 Tax=Hydatigena taeniaeformis TaxID=6205 RepID=A0A0R3WZ11_HYDTA